MGLHAAGTLSAQNGIGHFAHGHAQYKCRRGCRYGFFAQRFRYAFGKLFVGYGRGGCGIIYTLHFFVLDGVKEQVAKVVDVYPRYKLFTVAQAGTNAALRRELLMGRERVQP